MANTKKKAVVTAQAKGRVARAKKDTKEFRKNYSGVENAPKRDAFAVIKNANESRKRFGEKVKKAEAEKELSKPKLRPKTPTKGSPYKQISRYK